MIDQAQLTRLSRWALQQGLRIAQGYRFADTDREHVAKLLEYMKPGHGTVWLDIGCGFGEPAKLMHELRPDLDFILVNSNEYQLEHAPQQFRRVQSDMHDIPLSDATVDGAMFLYSLCQADDPVEALAEAHRVVRSGGRLFVFDYVTITGTHLDCPFMASQFFSFQALDRMCRSVSWSIDGHILPPGNDAIFRWLFQNDALYDLIFSELTPIVWWGSRQ